VYRHHQLQATPTTEDGPITQGNAMPLPLPKPIEVFMSSENAHDTDALAECFAPDATVRDEGQTLKGLQAIKAWRGETTKKYQHTVEPVAVATRDGKIVVSTKLTGNFPGSPVTLDFVFTLEGGKIAALEIKPWAAISDLRASARS
jgi:SnoaL-like protein